MKAIHVGNTRDSRLYYLLESDNQTTGAVVTPNQPAVYVDFFAYVSKKGSIERVMDSEFHKFFWTGHTGSLSERWEQTFIHRVTSPREMALSGVEILTEFKEKKKPSRVTQLNERSNRAVEYKALVGAGLNEKAFARRGVRRIGRGLGDAATGGVRGFRRGVRFDPEAEDADGDGFVQEGTQYARRAVNTGMRSSVWDLTSTTADKPTFLPPDKIFVPTAKTATTMAQEFIDYINHPFLKSIGANLTDIAGRPITMTIPDWHQHSLREQQDLIDQINDIYETIREQVGTLLDGNDAIDILESYERDESALRALIGGREIKTVKDAKEVAFIVHPLFKTHKSEFNLLTLPDPRPGDPHRRKWRDESDPLNDYERTLLVSALTMLAANPRFKTWPVWIEEGDLPIGVGGMERWQSGSEWVFDPSAKDSLAERVKKVLARMGGTWSESGMTREPLTPEERAQLVGVGVDPSLIDELELSREIPIGLTGMEGEDTRQVVKRNLIARLGEMLIPQSSRPGRSRVTYNKEANDMFVQAVENLIKGSITLDDGSIVPYNLTAADPTFRGRYVTATSLFVTLLAHADTLPPGEKKRVRRKAAALHAGAILVHELGGHATHSVNTIGWALEKIGPDPTGGGDDPRYKSLLSSAIKTISEKIRKIPLVEKFVLDSRTTSEFSKNIEDKGLGTVLQGKFGIEFEDIRIRVLGKNKSMFAPGQSLEDSFSARGIHGVLRHGTDIQKQRMKAWLSQPVMDKHGNPHTANSGLSKYFDELKEVALKEWGIDLTIGAGEQLTLAHVLFGTNPHEDGLPALTGTIDGRSTFKTNRKGPFAFLRRGQYDKRTDLPGPVTGTAVQYRARKARKKDGSHIHEHVKIASGDSKNTKGLAVPDLTMIREKGIPALRTKDVVQVDGATLGIETTAVTPEDAAPLLDALAHAAHLLPQLDDSEFDPAGGTIDEVLDQLENITFDSVPDVEIGLTGKKLGDFLEDMSPEQREAFREELSTDLVIDLVLQSMGTKGYVGEIAGNITAAEDPADVLGNPDLRPILDSLVEKLAMSAEWSDDLSDKHVRILTELADSLGYKDYAAYGGAVTGFDVLDFLLGNTRHEMIAELITAMVLGLDLPIFTGGKRRPLKPEQISALRALFELWHPGVTPKIRSRGRLAELYG